MCRQYIRFLSHASCTITHPLGKEKDGGLLFQKLNGFKMREFSGSVESDIFTPPKIPTKDPVLQW
jgi:hypothetical protein